MSTEANDSLQSKAILNLLDLIGEGEIGGLTNGLKSVYLNETPVQNPDGTYNFQGVTGSWVNGTNDQMPLPNFGSFSETPFNMGVQVKRTTVSTTSTVAADPYFGSVTSLLRGNVLQTDGSILDETQGGRVWTKSGNADISVLNSRFGGASLRFDGVGDYLSTPLASSMDVYPNAPWTIDGWFYEETGSGGAIVSQLGSGYPFNQQGWALYTYQFKGSVSSSWTDPAMTWVRPALNQWHHFALVHVNDQLFMYIDGVQVASCWCREIFVTGASSTKIGVASSALDNPFKGWIDDFRWTQGAARWTQGFTPPSYEAPTVYGPAPVQTNSPPQLLASFLDLTNTALDPHWSGVKTLLMGNEANGSTIISDFGNAGKIWTAYGNARISTDASVGPGGSMYFDGAGDYIRTPYSADLDLEAVATWTIDMWFYETGGLSTLLSHRSEWTDGWVLTTSSLRGNINGSWSDGHITWARPALNTWHHIAMQRSGSTISVYLNGRLVGTKTGVTSIYTEFPEIRIGVANNRSTPENPFQGYIDNLRWTNGVARYTSDFMLYAPVLSDGYQTASSPGNETAAPITFSITNPETDSVRVIMSVPSLSYTDTETGDISGTTVQYKFQRSIDGAPFTDIAVGDVWSNTGTIGLDGAYPLIEAAYLASRLRAGVKLVLNLPSGTTADPTQQGEAVVLAQGWNGSAWEAITTKTMVLEWASTGDYQAGGSDGDRIYTYALVTDPWVVETSYTKVRFQMLSSTNPYINIEGASVQSQSGTSVVTISGKSRSRYQRAHILQVPRPSQSVRFRVVRITADSTSMYLANDLYFDSYAEIISQNLRYPNSALFGLRIDSQQFNSIPNRAYLVDGLKIQVPTNYDPVARTYLGVWDGTFKRAVSSNPAWVMYDLLTNTRYGLGNFIGATQVDKATLYTIGRYCDEMVPDGFGGTEPRFTLNTVISSQVEAYKLISDIASTFRGMGFWDGGMVKFTQDAPSDPLMLYTPANVVDGAFNYTGSARKDRHSVVQVTWNDPEDNYKRKVEYVEDAQLINKYGIKKVDTLAFGCTSRGEAARVGRWILYTERYESDFITFKVGLDAAFVGPGDIIKIHDTMRAGKRSGGRLKSCTTTSATLDGPITITSTPATVSLMLEDGTLVERTVTNGVGTHSVLNWTSGLTQLPVENAVFLLSEPNLEPVLARVVSVAQDGPSGTMFEITAVENNPSKYDAIEDGLTLEKRKTSILDPTFLAAPSNVVVTEATYAIAPSVLATKLILSWYGNQTTYEISWRGVSTNNTSSWQTTTVVGGLTWELLSVIPGTYEFAITAINPLGARSTPTFVNYTVAGKVTPPSNVTNFSAEETLSGVRLSWSAIPDYDLASYEIRQSATLGGTWESATVVATVPGVTNAYVIGAVTAGTTHQWQIKAIDTSGNYSATATVVSYTKPATSNVTITYDYIGSALQLSWTSTNSPATWRVKQGASWSTGTLVGNGLTVTTLTVPVNWTTSQTFWVTPVDAANVEGTPVPINVEFEFPAAPTVQASVLGSSVLLSWNTPDSSLLIKRYEIRVGTSFVDGASLGSVVGNTATFPITWASNATVWVAAVDNNNNVGAAGSAVTTAQAPTTPTGLTATGALLSVTLNWNAATYQGHDYAEIFRSNTNSLASATAIGRTQLATFTDAVGEGGVTKYYWVRFVSQTGQASSFAGPVDAIPLEVSTGGGGGGSGSVMSNRLINGAFRIDQRNEGALQTFTAGAAIAYCVDRWYAQCTGANVTGQRITIGGKRRYRFFGASSNTGIVFGQRIESQHIEDLAGSTVTLQAKLSSSSVTSVDWAAYYPNTANTFSGGRTLISSGTFTIDSNESTYSAQLALNASATNGVEIVLTTAGLGASQTLTIGDVQLEAGSTASSFAYTPEWYERLACERYFEKSFPPGIAIANNQGAGEVFASGAANGGGFTSNMYFSVAFKTLKRAIPTLTWYNPRSTTAGTVSAFASGARHDIVPYTDVLHVYGWSGYVQKSMDSPSLASVHWTADAEL